MRPRGQRQIRSAKPVRFKESEFLQLEPLYITDEFKLMRVERLGPDVQVADLFEVFDPDTMDAEKYQHECMRQQAIYNARRRDYGILYYKPYEALKVEHDYNLGRHTAKRVINPGMVPNPALRPIDQPDCYEWTGTFPQGNFHQSQKRLRLLITANKNGKTTAVAADSIWLHFGIHPYIKMPVPNKGRIIGTDLAKGIEEDVWGIYKQLFPMSELSSEPRRHSSGQISKLNSKCGSAIEFMSYAQGEGENAKIFEGGEGNWVFFNEPPPEKIFSACSRWLMVRNGIMMFAMTPLWEAWIYDKLFLNQGPRPDQPGVFQMSVYENPYMSDDGVATLLKDSPDEEIEARIFGAFKHLTGLVYKEFSTAHRIPSFKMPKEWTRVMVMDYHPREACAILWAAVDPKGTLYFYDELKIDDSPLKIAEAIKFKEKNEYGRYVPTRWIDSLAATKDRQIPSGTAIREFRNCGETLKWPLSFRSSTKNHDLGFRAVHEYLKVINGVPGAYFFEDCVPNTIASMLHYQFEESDTIWAHFADCLRYICVTKPKFQIQLPDEYVAAEDRGEADSVTGYRGR